jgi:hypothetical protein
MLIWGFILGCKSLFVSPPIDTSHNTAKENSMSEKRYPRTRRNEVIRKFLVGIRQKKITGDLHQHGERTTGEKNAVDKQKS